MPTPGIAKARRDLGVCDRDRLLHASGDGRDDLLIHDGADLAFVERRTASVNVDGDCAAAAVIVSAELGIRNDRSGSRRRPDRGAVFANEDRRSARNIAAAGITEDLGYAAAYAAKKSAAAASRCGNFV